MVNKFNSLFFLKNAFSTNFEQFILYMYYVDTQLKANMKIIY